MAYVAVKGGEKAISAAHKLLAEMRRGDTTVPEIDTTQIREQLGLAVDRVMAEASCYDPDLAALALKQAWGDIPEAVFLLRAYRTTLPRLAVSLPVDTATMAVQRRVSAMFKDIPGGQILGPTFDYTHRLFDFNLTARAGFQQLPADVAEQPIDASVQTIAEVMAPENLLQAEVPQDDAGVPYDLTRDPPRYPAGRDQRLQALARGDEGFLLSIGYSVMRGWGGDHPWCGEVRLGEVAVEINVPEFGFPVDFADIVLTECHMIGDIEFDAAHPPQFTRGYGLAFGRSERKVMSMAILDRSLSAAAAADRAPRAAAEDEEFVLSHADNVEASGFVQHLKLPHYVDFQSQLQLVRKLREEWFQRVEAAQDGETPMQEAAE
jgi:alpha-D-ribose 1-methylphosphonate 5-triphosphate synthase subunit PhnI